MIKFIATITAVAATALAHGATPDNLGKVDPAVEQVSLVALIANPDKYEGKPVRVIGAFRLEFEGNEICLHKEDLINALSQNCLWISLDGTKLWPGADGLSRLNDHYVLVEGHFTTTDRGHMGMDSGAIIDIWRVSDWSWATRK
jgi:hypothetical protein